MRRPVLACALLLCMSGHHACASAAESAAATTTTPELRFYRQQVAEAAMLHDADRHGEAALALDALLRDPRFDALGKDEQRALLSAAAWSRARSGDLEGASGLYGRANTLGFDDPDDWYRLALVESDRGRHDEAAHALTQLVQLRPDLLPNLDPDFPHHLLRRAEPASDQRLQLMQALFDANWQGASDSDSVVWYQLALQRVIRGEPERARGPIRRIRDPISLVRLRSDRRFDALVDRDAWAFDVALAAERDLQALRDEADARADSIDARLQLGYALLTNGRHQELLAMVDTAIDRIAAAEPGEQAFADMHDQVWLLDHRARALRGLGRHEEAIAELQRASRLMEDGNRNTSQVLNLGFALCGMQRPREALDAIESVGEMSGYGRMVQAGVRVCAAAQLGDAVMLERELAYLHEHRDESEINYLEALVAAGRQDNAAAYLVEMLASQDLRADALEWMQDYARSHPLPQDVEYLADKTKLLARDDVRAALAPVGRIETYTIHGNGEIL